jgi:hypothetical protein
MYIYDTGLWPSVLNPYVSVGFLFFSSSRNRVCVSASQAQLFSVCSSLRYRSVFKIAAIQWVTISVWNNFFVCERILPCFSVDFVFSLLCTFVEVNMVFSFHNVSGNAISGSLQRLQRTLRKHLFWITEDNFAYSTHAKKSFTPSHFVVHDLYLSFIAEKD